MKSFSVTGITLLRQSVIYNGEGAHEPPALFKKRVHKMYYTDVKAAVLRAKP